MKNKYQISIVLFVLALVSLGCSFLPGGGSSGGPQSGNTAVNANAVEMAKTGVPECDEVVDMITRDMQSQDQGYIAGYARQVAVDLVKQGVKDTIEKNQGDKTKIASDCRLIKQEYERSRAAQNSNQ